MTENNVKLLPCDHCGSGSTFEGNTFEGNSDIAGHWVACLGCGVRTMLRSCAEEARNDWNRRATGRMWTEDVPTKSGLYLFRTSLRTTPDVTFIYPSGSELRMENKYPNDDYLMDFIERRRNNGNAPGFWARMTNRKYQTPSFLSLDEFVDAQRCRSNWFLQWCEIRLPLEPVKKEA